MAKKRSFDVKQIGRLLFDKGERIGLAVSAVVLVLLVALGVVAGSTSLDWAGVLKRQADDSTAQILTAEPPPGLADTVRTKVEINWDLLDPKKIPSQVSWQAIEEHNDLKRRNPYCKPLIVREVQMDFLQGAYYGNEVDMFKKQVTAYLPAGAKDGSKATNPARIIRPKRMVVVSAAFPYKEQLEVFQKALRFPEIKDLIASKDDMPKFLGLVVTRYEILPNGQPGEQVALFNYDEAREKTMVAEKLGDVFRDSIYQTVPVELRPFVRPGLVTPLPEMAIGTYPRLDLPTIKAEAIPPAGMTVGGNAGGPKPLFNLFPQPMGNQPAVEGGQYAPISIDTLPKPMQDKIYGKNNLFDPDGGTGNDPKFPFPQPFPVRQPGGEQPPPVGGGELPGDTPEKILVRFFDVDVQPGRSYSYKIEIRLHNPNFGKAKEVASIRDSEIKEFRSPPVVTPTPIVIPRDFDFYAFDQSPLESKAIGTDVKPMTIDRNVAPVQIHRWIEKSEAGNWVGDYAVAERLLVRRGEIIGRNEVIAEVPEWITTKERFELRTTPLRRTFGGKQDTPGIPIDFRITNPAPLLVDFDGGKRYYRDELENLQINDDAELQLLVLTAEGKLVLRSSAVDGNEQTPTGRERAANYNQWRDRLRQFRSDAPAKGGN